MVDQLPLFALPPAVEAALDGPLSRAPRLPLGVHVGTSSWSFPGWAGLVYKRAYSEPDLAHHGLRAYAQLPVLNSVGVDRAHYRPVPLEDWRGYAEQVPATFRFLAKAHEATTLVRYPEHARYGDKRGQANPLFLEPAYASAEVVAPYVEGVGERAGPLLFQFAPQSALGEPLAFARRLGRFLRALPRGPRYAVEVRNPELVTQALADEILAAGAVPCLTVWGLMPALALQAARLRALDGACLVMRWMLPRELDYETARQRYLPFDRLVDERLEVRSAIVTLTQEALAGGRPVFIIVNNKAEGSAPLSIVKLAEALLA
jgi:uncharacterized protein YecE (DUF72 family)